MELAALSCAPPPLIMLIALIALIVLAVLAVVAIGGLSTNRQRLRRVALARLRGA